MTSFGFISTLGNEISIVYFLWGRKYPAQFRMQINESDTNNDASFIIMKIFLFLI